MTTLSDNEITSYLESGLLGIDPWEPFRLQPSTVDLLLDSCFLVPELCDPLEPPVSICRADKRFPRYQPASVPRFILEPQKFILGSTREVIRVGPSLRARVEGKSTLGRLGLLVHCTAGYIDPGFEGQITLELFNVASYAIELVAGEPICQLAFERLSSTPARCYGAPELGSHYQGQRNVTEPKL